MFPGEKSPGLIEAPGAGRTARLPAASFRGRNPPASLKPAADRAVHGVVEGFPGEKSPGLIEAMPAVSR